MRLLKGGNGKSPEILKPVQDDQGFFYVVGVKILITCLLKQKNASLHDSFSMFALFRSGVKSGFLARESNLNLLQHLWLGSKYGKFDLLLS